MEDFSTFAPGPQSLTAPAIQNTRSLRIFFPAVSVFLCKACDNRKSQSIYAQSPLTRGHESDLIMLLHYWLMPWTLLENRLVIMCSHTVFIMMWQPVMPAEIRRPVAIYTWFEKQQVILWWRRRTVLFRLTLQKHSEHRMWHFSVHTVSWKPNCAFC